MDLMHDVDTDTDSEGRGGSAAADHGRWARHLDNQRRFRRRLAIGLAAAGVIAIVIGLSWQPGKNDAGPNKPEPVTVNGVTDNTAKPPTTGPGGVGTNPEGTGLPAVPATGGRVRTGTKEEGCFANMRDYLDAWDRTGQEPDPCFLPQAPADQQQPDGVVRSYNGEKF
ncbi:MAG TPA: hypothetical protein VG795_01390 [Acidimicrobiia bacterium]|nr:hypothetical protein [Acidimicrobiia bacterium]